MDRTDKILVGTAAVGLTILGIALSGRKKKKSQVDQVFKKEPPPVVNKIEKVEPKKKKKKKFFKKLFNAATDIAEAVVEAKTGSTSISALEGEVHEEIPSLPR